MPAAARIALVQMRMRPDGAGQVQGILAELARAAQAGAQLCVFPELALPGFHRGIRAELNPARLDDAVAQVAQAAARLRIACAVGLPWAAESQWQNALLLLDEQGRYRGLITKQGLTPSEATLFVPGPARASWPLAGLALSAVFCREVLDYPAGLPGLRPDLLLWPSFIRRAADEVDYLPAARALARASAAPLLQCNWANSINHPERDGFGGSALIGADGRVQLQLPADAAGLALWQAGVAPEWRPAPQG